jgi:hypothetical protein
VILIVAHLPVSREELAKVRAARSRLVPFCTMLRRAPRDRTDRYRNAVTRAEESLAAGRFGDFSCKLR